MKISIRFPNESELTEVNFDKEYFNLEKKLDNEVFGWYKGTYIAIKRTDYNAIFV